MPGGGAVWQSMLRDFWEPFQQLVAATTKLKVREVVDVLDALVGPHFFPVKVKGDKQ